MGPPFISAWDYESGVQEHSLLLNTAHVLGDIGACPAPAPMGLTLGPPGLSPSTVADKITETEEEAPGQGTEWSGSELRWGCQQTLSMQGSEASTGLVSCPEELT